MATEANPYIRHCGCSHAGPGHDWKRCLEHAHRESIERTLETAFGTPICPEGCGDARRPKCAWEAADCPRHDVTRAWKRLLDAAAAYVPGESEEPKR